MAKLLVLATWCRIANPNSLEKWASAGFQIAVCWLPFILMMSLRQDFVPCSHWLKNNAEEKCSPIMLAMKRAKRSDFERPRKTHSREVNLKIFKIEPRGKLPTLRSQIKSSKTSLRLQEWTSFQTNPFNFGQHLVVMCFGVQLAFVKMWFYLPE